MKHFFCSFFIHRVHSEAHRYRPPLPRAAYIVATRVPRAPTSARRCACARRNVFSARRRHSEKHTPHSFDEFPLDGGYQCTLAHRPAPRTDTRARRPNGAYQKHWQRVSFHWPERSASVRVHLLLLHAMGKEIRLALCSSGAAAVRSSAAAVLLLFRIGCSFSSGGSAALYSLASSSFPFSFLRSVLLAARCPPMMLHSACIKHSRVHDSSEQRNTHCRRRVRIYSRAEPLILVISV